MHLAHQFAADGGAALWVSSDFDETVQVANRVIVLRDGQLIKDLPNTPEAPLTEEALLIAVQ
jgi:ABC-type sugar transport system ATPase subunit